MKIWNTLSNWAVSPVSRVPWGLDRGVADEEFHRFRASWMRAMVLYFVALMGVDIASCYLPKPAQYIARWIVALFAVLWIIAIPLVRRRYEA